MSEDYVRCGKCSLTFTLQFMEQTDSVMSDGTFMCAPCRRRDHDKASRPDPFMPKELSPLLQAYELEMRER